MFMFILLILHYVIVFSSYIIAFTLRPDRERV